MPENVRSAQPVPAAPRPAAKCRVAAGKTGHLWLLQVIDVARCRAIRSAPVSAATGEPAGIVICVVDAVTVAPGGRSRRDCIRLEQF